MKFNSSGVKASPDGFHCGWKWKKWAANKMSNQNNRIELCVSGSCSNKVQKQVNNRGNASHGLTLQQLISPGLLTPDAQGKGGGKC